MLNIRHTLAIAITALILAGLSSCTVYSERDRLQAQNDSLIVAHAQLEAEINGYFETLTDISENLDKVKQIEGILAQPQTEGVQQDPTQDINNSINTISDIIRDNNRKITDMTKRLKNSSFRINKLEKQLANLTTENERLAAQIVTFHEQLANRDQTIAAQNLSIAALSDSTAALASQMRTATSKIDAQTEQIYTAWYVFGTTRELKAQGIVGKSGTAARTLLKGDFNRDYFVRIDTRQVTEIPLYSKRAKILTTHPTDSYILEKLNGLYTLRITDPASFWTISNYLVIDID